jgi:AraC-like DNA-binding protein
MERSGADHARLAIVRPSPPLRSIVAHWSYREVDVRAIVRLPLPARPLQFIEFYLGESIALVDWRTGKRSTPPGRCVVVGHHTRRMNDIELCGNYRTFTMHLMPTGFHRLTGVPMHEFTDGAVDATAVFGNEADDVREHLENAGTLDERVAVAERFVMRRMNGVAARSAIDAAADHLRFGTQTDLDALVGAAGLSARQFERRFSAAVGMPPKTFQRVSRFHRAVRRKETTPAARWTDIAVDLGYYDQAHLVRDAKLLAGEAASALLERMLAADRRLRTATSYFS